jgi:hypothetical protein
VLLGIGTCPCYSVADMVYSSPKIRASGMSYHHSPATASPFSKTTGLEPSTCHRFRDQYHTRNTNTNSSRDIRDTYKRLLFQSTDQLLLQQIQHFSATMNAFLDKMQDKPVFAAGRKLPVHIFTAILVIIAMALSVPRLFVKHQPRTRANTIALGMVRPHQKTRRNPANRNLDTDTDVHLPYRAPNP